MPGRQVTECSAAVQEERAWPGEHRGASRMAGPGVARTAEAVVRGVEACAPGTRRELDRPWGEGQHDRGAVAHEGNGPVARDDGRRVGPGRAEPRDTCTQGEQLAVETAQLGAPPGAIEDGGPERVLGLGIRHIALPGELLEFLAAAAPHGFDERRVAVAREVEERPRLAVLLAHEEHRREGPEEQRGRRDLRALAVDERHQAVAARAVADLIV